MSFGSGGWRRPALLVVVLAVLVGGAGAATTTSQPSGEAVFDDARERYENAESLVTTANVTAANATANASATVEFAAAGNQSRLVVTTDNGTYRAGVNETVAWYVAPNRTAAWNRDAVGPSVDGPTLPNGSVANWENVTADYLRRGSDDGTDAHVIEVTYDGADERRSATLWVATTDARVLRARMDDGTNRTTVDYRDSRFNASIHPSTFDPPADRLAVTPVARYDSFTAAQANTTLGLPELDAAFREATVVERASSTTVAQTYRADTDNVTVVSTTSDREFDRATGNATAVTVNGHDANVTTMRERAVVYWTDDDVRTALVVDANEDRAIDLARRLEERHGSP